MKEAFVYAGPKVDVAESSIPTPGPFQIIVKVICVGLNPKDWKVADGAVPGVTYSNEGDDFAGFVHEVGQQVTEFKVGDRVGAFHKTLSPGGGWAEYAVAWESMTFHLAEHVSFESWYSGSRLGEIMEAHLLSSGQKPRRSLWQPLQPL
jgi:NADPH:quinone reductase-like Zn-dependent oxidoreductase